MRIISSVVLALIAGIFRYTDAMEDLLSICIKNGGSQAVEDLTKFAMNLSATCNKSSQNGTLPQKQEAHVWKSSELAKICDDSETYIKCTRGLVDMAKICGRPDQRELFDVSQNVIAASNKFICENDNYIKELFESPDRQCLSTKSPAVLNCFAKYRLGNDSQDFNQWSPEKMNPTAIILNLEPDFNNKTCNNIQKFEQCSIEAMAECENEKFSKLLESLFKYINNDIPCENLSKTPRSYSEALSGSLVNVLLLFYVVITMTF